MKRNNKFIAIIAGFVIAFAVTTIQASEAQAGPFGTYGWGVTASSLGSGR